uniref:Uncharacterized protein n=1 Tax=Ciona intestinalis TaxID=7719 RepID=H2XQY8_CIOIN
MKTTFLILALLPILSIAKPVGKEVYTDKQIRNEEERLEMDEIPAESNIAKNRGRYRDLEFAPKDDEPSSVMFIITQLLSLWKRGNLDKPSMFSLRWWA